MNYIKRIIQNIEKKTLIFFEKYPILYNLGYIVYKNTYAIILSLTILLFIVFLENNFTQCIDLNLKLIDFLYVNIAFMALFTFQIILFIIFFSIERKKFDQNISSKLETNLRYSNNNQINLLPLFLLLNSTFINIYIYLCKFDFSNISKNIIMIAIFIVFLYSWRFWFKYKSKANQSFSISYIAVSIIYILLICHFDILLPYIQEIINLSKCIFEHILSHTNTL